jgi:hypothetical protein
MSFLMKYRGFFPEGSLRFDRDNRACRITEGRRKRLSGIRLNGVDVGRNLGCERTNFEPDGRADVLSSERRRIAHVDGMWINVVDT